MGRETPQSITVQPWPAPEGTTGNWPCGLCGQPHPVTDSWRITRRTVHGPSAATVCRDCALEAQRAARSSS